MNFNYFDLGHLSAGATVRVNLEGDAPNVRLVDSSNYRLFSAGREHRYYGGHAKSSPVLLQIPHTGYWYVVLDYGGYAGRGRASVQVISAA